MINKNEFQNVKTKKGQVQRKKEFEKMLCWIQKDKNIQSVNMGKKKCGDDQGVWMGEGKGTMEMNEKSENQ